VNGKRHNRDHHRDPYFSVKWGLLSP
jgi:hypothetical protein